MTRLPAPSTQHLQQRDRLLSVRDGVPECPGAEKGTEYNQKGVIHENIHPQHISNDHMHHALQYIKFQNETYQYQAY